VPATKEEEGRTRRSSEREPADSLRDESNVIGGWLPSLTFTLAVHTPPPSQQRKTRLQEFTAALREHLHKAKLICYSLLLIVGVTQIIIREHFPELHPPWMIIGTALMIVLFGILLVPPLLMAFRLRKKSESERPELHS
jgi:protein-S-isoprenylcysteine O-methyltransferase Ste14